MIHGKSCNLGTERFHIITAVRTEKYLNYFARKDNEGGNGDLATFVACMTKSTRWSSNKAARAQRVVLPHAICRSGDVVGRKYPGVGRQTRSVWVVSWCILVPVNSWKGLRFNPRPDTVFRHLLSDRGGGCDPPLAFPNEAS